VDFCFGGGGLNPGPCIFYALSIPTELSSRGQQKWIYEESEKGKNSYHIKKNKKKNKKN